MSEKDESLVTRKECQVSTGRVLVSHERLHRKLDSIEKRLFKDNGHVCLCRRAWIAMSRCCGRYCGSWG